MTQLTRSLLTLAIAAGVVLNPMSLGADRASMPDQAALQAPTDLKAMLVGPVSEARLVVTRYTLDRNTLAGNFAGEYGAGGGGGRGGGRGGRG
ncbi:MAG TPA: hypothetical protein VFV98_06395, partial [Vicinamibacterales bacterium]|nr:hypothetical protein [Vicinamibacterales bacterium]